MAKSSAALLEPFVVHAAQQAGLCPLVAGRADHVASKGEVRNNSAKRAGVRHHEGVPPSARPPKARLGHPRR